MLIQQIDRIPLHPSLGNTTLEICFKLIINHKPFIITLSWGDSETIIYKNDGTLLQLNSGVISRRGNNKVVEIHKIKDLNQSNEFYKPFSDPIATIGFDSNTNPTVTYGELEPGDMIITCSDGLTDGISNLSHDKSSSCLDKRFLKTLLDYCNSKKLNE